VSGRAGEFQTYTFKVDMETGEGEQNGRFEFGRNGKLTNDHPYLSGVVILRQREHSADRIDEISADLRGDGPPREWDKAAEEVARLINRIQQEDLPEGDYLYCDVIEAISEVATPIPTDLLDGSRDSRWRRNVQGFFVRVDASRT
jgi:hypothetical protein